nr:putative capsid [Marmot picobirnavirus]
MAKEFRKDDVASKGKKSDEDNGAMSCDKKTNSNYRKRNSRNNRYRKDGNRPTNKSDSRSGQGHHTSSAYVGVGNDPRWYSGDSQLIADASKFSFANQLGSKIFTRPHPTLASGGGYITSDVIPGVAALKMVNTPGIAGDQSDGVNIAAADLFQRMRAGLNTYAAYAAPDVMMYVLAVDAVYSMYGNIARVFGILPTYQGANLYTPTRLLHAGYGFSEAEVAAIIKEKANYLTRFNQLVFKASTLYLPIDFTVVSRHAWLYMNYFVDESSTKAQYYIHRMMGAHKLNETLSDQGTFLEYIENPTTLSGLLDQFEVMINAIRNSDSMQKIRADMEGALKESTKWTLSYIQDTYVLAPVSDPLVLLQIHNTSIYPTFMYEHLKTIAQPVDNEFGFAITQSVTRNVIIAGPRYAFTGNETASQLTSWNTICQEKMLDFPVQDVTSDLIIEATRNTLGGAISTLNDKQYATLMNTGVDLCVGLTIEGRNPFDMDSIYSLDIDGQAVSVSNAVELRGLVMLSRFYSAPYLVVQNVGWGQSGGESTLIGSVNNYTMVDATNISTLNSAIMIAMWGIPGTKMNYNK